MRFGFVIGIAAGVFIGLIFGQFALIWAINLDHAVIECVRSFK